MNYNVTVVESEEGFAVWCDDLPEYFRFYLKVDALADVSAEHIEVLGEHLGAFLLPESAVKSDNDRCWYAMSDSSWGEPDQPISLHLV